MDEAASSPDLQALQRPLEHFRAKTRHLTIHPLEQLLLWVVAAHLVFLPWALGGMRPWGQWTSLVFAAVGFLISLIPRNYTEDHTGANSFRLIPWPRLIRFPLFWIGLAMLVYVSIQALNPAWIFVRNDKYWWMQKVLYVTWLPSGVRVPFERWGPWRMFIIYAATWLTVCSIWVGFTRRRSVQALFIVIAANGLALAGFGVLQKLLSNGKMFWFWESPNSSFFASFVYKNHAGNYLNLALAVTCGLAAWFFLRGLRRMEKSNPSGVFAFFATCIAIAILVSYARGATVAMLVFLVCCVGVFVVHQLLMKNTTRKPIVAVMLMIVFGFFMKTGLEALNSREAWSRLRQGIMEEDVSLESRRVAREASLDMAKDYWVQGAGAGSFRFLFTLYQQHYPSIYHADGTQLFWEHAHNDILEIALEQGVAGLALIFAAGGYLAVLLTRGFCWQNPLSGCVVLGAALMFVQAWWDFPFHCPAVFLLWWSLLVLATMSTQFEEMNIKS